MNELRSELEEVSQATTSAALISITVSENLGEDVKEVFLKRLEGVSNNGVNFRFVQCKECLTVRAETDADGVYVKKGVTNEKDFKRMVQLLGTKTYAEANLSYSGTKLTLLVNFFGVADRSLVLSKSYSTRVLHTTKTGFKTSATVAQFFTVGGVRSYPFGGSILFAERIYGLGEFGLGTLGYAGEGLTKSYVSLGPNLRLNLNEITDSPASWGALLLTMRLHYGAYDGKNRDISFGGGLKVEIGSIFHMLLEAQSSMTLNSETKAGTATEQLKSPTAVLLGFGFDMG